MEQLQLKDFEQYRFLSEIKYAPDGKRAAFVVSQADEEENAYTSRLYLYDGAVKPLTHLGKERGFTWLDETHLLFPAVRTAAEKKRAEEGDAFTAYYSLDVTGGEAQPAFTLPFEAEELRVLDTTHFAVTGRIDVRHPDAYLASEEDRAAIVKEDKENKDYEVFDELPFWMNGAGVTNGRRTALFLVSLEPFSVRRVSGPRDAVGAVAVLGDEVFFDRCEVQVKPDLTGCRIAAVNWKTGEVREVLQRDHFAVSTLLAAENSLVAFATVGEQYGLNENEQLFRLTPQGEVSLLRAETRSTYGIVGSDCRYGSGAERAMRGEVVYHIATREGNAILTRTLADGTEETVLARDGSVDSFAVSDHSDKALLIGLYDMKLQELYELDLATGALKQLTDLNSAVLAGKYVAKPRPLTAESEGLKIGGWVLEPKDFDPDKRYPAVLDIHGGPKTVYGPVFYHEMQLWANRGYFVFFCNPKGSDGRDNAFADIRGAYGETDYRNLMAFTDAVLSVYPQIDPARLCVTGGSYGGFMTNWIIGHTDRFCCAASQRSIANWTSFVGVSDIGFFFATDQCGANIDDHPEKIWAQSPLKYAAAVKTPTLFIHADQDYRCPMDQGIQMYAALAERGVPTRLCLFHGENHELSRSGKPKHRVRRLEEITAWFERYASSAGGEG